MGDEVHFTAFSACLRIALKIQNISPKCIQMSKPELFKSPVFPGNNSLSTTSLLQSEKHLPDDMGHTVLLLLIRQSPSSSNNIWSFWDPSSRPCTHFYTILSSIILFPLFLNKYFSESGSVMGTGEEMVRGSHIGPACGAQSLYTCSVNACAHELTSFWHIGFLRGKAVLHCIFIDPLRALWYPRCGRGSSLHSPLLSELPPVYT